MKKLVVIFISTFLLISCTRQFPQAKYDQAYETFICGNYKDASKQLARLCKTDSVYPEIWYTYGSCCMETGDYNTAIKAFQKTAELYENSVMYDNKIGLRNDAMTSIGEVYLLQKDFNKAADQFEKCLELQHNRDMVIAIVAAYIRLGFTAECESYFADKGINIADIN